MTVKRIYLETTIFNYYFDEDRGIAHLATLELFRRIEKGLFEPFTSRYVIDELEQTQNAEKLGNMLGLVDHYAINVFPEDTEAEALAEIYVAEGVVPAKYLTDGIHIAMTAIKNLDLIVSMNFQHIVKQKTKRVTPVINALQGYNAVEIYSPEEVINHDFSQ